VGPFGALFGGLRAGFLALHGGVIIHHLFVWQREIYFESLQAIKPELSLHICLITKKYSAPLINSYMCHSFDLKGNEHKIDVSPDG